MQSQTKQSTSSQLNDSQLQNYHIQLQLLDKLVINNNKNNNNHYYYYREQLVNSLQERVSHLEDQLSEATSLQVC